MYVFGVDLPIMELLFVFGILLSVFGIFLLITLIVIWKEVRGLKELILTEKSNIYRFEEDITVLKPKDKQKHEKELDKFIRQGLEKGFSKQEILAVLIKKKWPRDVVEEALAKA